MFLNFLGRIWRQRKNKHPIPPNALVLKEGDHNFQLAQFDPHAVSILEKLDREGFDACLVGGCLRDVTLGLEAKDCDVATNARPEQAKKYFKRSMLIGRRFKLVHVRFGRHVIEVATYRSKGGKHQKQLANGRLVQDNAYGSLEEDVWRRDFTINALYFRYRDRTLIDCFGGLEDLKERCIRSIGDPNVRFQEDPIRMLRAVRFSAKLDFEIGEAELQAMTLLRNSILEVPEQRLFHEMVKLFYTGYAEKGYHALKKFELFPLLFPSLLDHFLRYHDDEKLIEKALQQTDSRYKRGDSLNPVFVFAVLYWPIFHRNHIPNLLKKKLTLNGFKREYEYFVTHLKLDVRLSKKQHEMIIDMYYLQIKMRQLSSTTVRAVLKFKKIRAAFDLLLLRQENEGGLEKIVDYWRRFIEKKRRKDQL